MKFSSKLQINRIANKGVTRRYQRIDQLTQWIEGFGAEHPEVVDYWSALYALTERHTCPA